MPVHRCLRLPAVSHSLHPARSDTAGRWSGPCSGTGGSDESGMAARLPAPCSGAGESGVAGTSGLLPAPHSVADAPDTSARRSVPDDSGRSGLHSGFGGPDAAALRFVLPWSCGCPAGGSGTGSGAAAEHFQQNLSRKRLLRLHCKVPRSVLPF